jgi:hypothetical protein
LHGIGKGGKSCGQLPVFFQRCAQLVEEPIPIPPVDPQNGPAPIVGTTRPKPSGDAAADMAGKPIYEKSAKEFQDELEKEVVGHSRGMMALTGRTEKAGKA